MVILNEGVSPLTAQKNSPGQSSAEVNRNESIIKTLIVSIDDPTRDHF